MRERHLMGITFAWKNYKTAKVVVNLNIILKSIKINLILFIYSLSVILIPPKFSRYSSCSPTYSPSFSVNDTSLYPKYDFLYIVLYII